MTQSEKISKYEEIVPQIQALVSGVKYGISSLANFVSALHRNMDFFWTGFYVVDGENLLLGPFQGDTACITIAKGKGVCGTSWAKEQTIVVEDVERFPGHIACSSLSKSEIVVPVFSKSGKITAVLDIDSDRLATFDDIDKKYLEKAVTYLQEYDSFI
ncbi:MAG: GAF domain-containing protein [Bacteroidales bacterium]|nr:GAF domain-containing protein [Bacteroidales bacterium]